MRINTIKAALFFANTALVIAWNHVDEAAFIRAVGGHNLALVACKLELQLTSRLGLLPICQYVLTVISCRGENELIRIS